MGADGTEPPGISMCGSALTAGSEGGLPPKPLLEQGWEAQLCLI